MNAKAALRRTPVRACPSRTARTKKYSRILLKRLIFGQVENLSYAGPTDCQNHVLRQRYHYE